MSNLRGAQHDEVGLDAPGELHDLPVGALYPSHGPPIPDGRAKLEAYRLHREMREKKVLGSLKKGRLTLAEIAKAAYAELGSESFPVAERSTQAHLIKLMREGKVTRSEDRYVLSPEA